MIDTLCHILWRTTWKEITKCTVYGHGEVMYGNSHVHIKSDALSATTMRKLKYRKKTIPVASHTTGCLRSIWETYDTIIQRDLSYSDEEIRIFYWKSIERNMSMRLMATWISASAYLSKIRRNILNSNRTIEKTNMRDQREIKIATLAITACASILMCSVNTLQNL